MQLSLSHEGSETGSGSGAETSLKVGSGSGSEKNHSGSATLAGIVKTEKYCRMYDNTNVNVPAISNERKNFKGKLVFVGILKATEEKSTTQWHIMVAT